MTEATPGEFYWGVVCKKCGNPILLFHDKSRGKRGIPFAGPGKLRVTCSYQHCGHQHDYGVADIQLFQIPFVA